MLKPSILINVFTHAMCLLQGGGDLPLSRLWWPSSAELGKDHQERKVDRALLSAEHLRQFLVASE